MVDNANDPHPVELVLLLDAEGKPRAHEVGRQGQMLDRIGGLLRGLLAGTARARRPTCLRVATPVVAERLADEFPELEVVCAPTPELDHLVAFMMESFKKLSDGEPDKGWAAAGTDPAAVAAFFSAAAALYRARPWKMVPTDEDLISVTITAFGVDCALLSVMGPIEQSPGILLFDDAADFQGYLDAIEACIRQESMSTPATQALTFDRLSDLPREQRQEILAQGWELADAKACPIVTIAAPGRLPRAPTAEELVRFEAIARALPMLLADGKAMRAAWRGKDRIERSFRVPTHAGEVTVVLRAPGVGSVRESAECDVLLRLALLERRQDQAGWEARREVEAELLRLFDDSPEGRAVEATLLPPLLHLAHLHLDASVASLRPRELEELVFELIPRHVAIDRAQAPAILAECRAFFAFLGRACGLVQADACLRVLGDGALERLTSALGDGSRFGLAKSLLMGTLASDLDASSPEALAQSLQKLVGKRLPNFPEPPPPPLLPPTPGRKPWRPRGKRS